MCEKNGKKKGLQKKRNNCLNLFRFLNFKRFGIYKITAKLFFKESVVIFKGLVFIVKGIATTAKFINVTSLAGVILLILFFQGRDVIESIILDEIKLTALLGFTFTKKANLDAEVGELVKIEALMPDSLGLDLEELTIKKKIEGFDTNEN